MYAIRDVSILALGDVVYHAYLGFARIEEIDEAGAGLLLTWEDPDADAPSRVPASTAVEEFHLCVPTGFLYRSVVEPAPLAHQVVLEPGRALRLLIEELGEPVDADTARRWLVGRDLISEDEFDRWWRGSKRYAQENPAFHVAGGRVSLVPRAEQGSPASPQAFLSAGPQRRFDVLSRLQPAERQAILDAALRVADIEAVVLVLRGWSPLPTPAVDALRALVRGGESRVAAALLSRAQPELLQDFAQLAAAEEGHALLTEALDQLPPRQRANTVDLLRQRARSLPHAEAALRFLGTLPDFAAEPRYTPRETEPLDELFPSPDTTVDVALDPGAKLLTQLEPLAAHRLLPTSVAVARALAARHAAGQAGGLLGARMRPGGSVELGAPEDSTPARDVRDAMRMMAELAIGRRPPAQRFEDEHLLSHLPLLVPGAPVDWLAVLAASVATDLTQRPVDGLDLWTRLELASAQDRVRAAASPRTSARLEVAHDTHIGLLKSRLGQVNQDAVFWYTEGASSLLIVADGISISTAGSGDLASSILVRVMVALWEQNHERLAIAGPEEIRAFLDHGLATANQAICNASARLAGGDLSQHIPMGTTALVALVQGATVYTASLGDSRIFLSTRNGTAQLTGDQNLRAEWLLAWQRGRPGDLVGDGHALTGYCGHFNEHLQAEPVPPVHRTVTLLPGEVLVLCSDGFTDYAADGAAAAAALLDPLYRVEDLGDACRDLTNQANARGGGDNITVLLARLSSDVR